MRKLLGVVLAVVALWANGAHAFDVVLERPDAFGDQVIAYYDARPDYTTFISLRSGSQFDDRIVNLLFYGPDLGPAFSKLISLPGGRLTVIDVGALRGEGLPATPGIMIATAVDESGRPIATGALAGNFTVANLLTGSAFGAASAARSALDDQGNTLTDGTVIGPDTALLQLIQPRTAFLAAFYDPATLAPAANGGNQLIFIDFVDTYSPAYGAVGGSTTWNLIAAASNGIGFPDRLLTVSGVTVTDLASVLGPSVNGSGGGISFIAGAATPGVNRLVFFAEALGTFGTGYLLPPLNVRLSNN